MEKPPWRVRESVYVVDSPYLRLRKDAIELPNGTLVPDYYVRESPGFVMIVPLTQHNEVVLVRQYRYGNDSVGIELPAGSLAEGEAPLDCAKRELQEETGFTAQRWEALGSFAAEPVRSNAVMHVFLACDCAQTAPQSLDPTEHIDVEIATVSETLELMRTGRMGSVACVAAGYLALDRIGAFAGL